MLKLNKGDIQIRRRLNYKNTNGLITLLLMVGFIFLGLSAVSTVSAADSYTIYVNDSSGNDNWDGQYNEWISGLMGPKKSIKNATGTVSEGGTVHIAKGKYTGVNNTNISINKNMTIIGQSKEDTIINGTNSAWIFNIQSNKNVTIANLTFVNGNSSVGGAIYNHGILTVKNCTFTGNAATNFGGAIYNYGGSLNINDCNFFNNAANSYGGAIYNVNGGNLNVNNSTFINNRGYWSGAIYNRETCVLTLNNSIFTGNTASGHGGAIYNEGILTAGNCTFTSNFATSGYGGAVYNTNASSVTGSTFNSNSAGQYGGAIYNGATSATLNVACSKFHSNNAGQYGGAVCNSGTSSTLNISGSIFSGNSATSNGGAVYNTNLGNSIVQFCRISGNTPNDIYKDSGSVDVRFNWWGSNADPSGRVIGTTVTQWLVLNIKGLPLKVGPNQASTITANVYTDSNGIDHSSDASKFFSDSEVTFTTTFGNLNPLSSIMVNGQATSSLTASAFGSADITANLDNQPVSTTITITDIIPPTVTSVDPVNKAKIKIVNKEIKITFSEPIQAGSAYDTISLTGPSGAVPMTKSITGNVLTLMPAFNYVNGNYGIVIPVNAITDSFSNSLAAAFYSNFNVDTVKPTSWANIKTGSYNVSKSIMLSISEPGIIYYTKNGTTPTTASTKYSGPIAITSTTALKFFAVDLAGNPSSVYTEKYIIDRTAPKLISTTPRNRATGVSRTGTIAIKLSENIKAGINWSKITVKNRYGKAVSITKKISGNMLYIKTTYKRSSYSYYTVYVPKAAVKDYAGNNFAGYYFRFKTGRY